MSHNSIAFSTICSLFIFIFSCRFVRSSIYIGEKPWEEREKREELMEDRKQWEDYFGDIKKARVLEHKRFVFDCISKSSKVAFAVSFAMAVVQFSRKKKANEQNQTLADVDPILLRDGHQQRSNQIEAQSTKLLSWKEEKFKRNCEASKKNSSAVQQPEGSIDEEEENMADERAVLLRKQKGTKSPLQKALSRVGQLAGIALASIFAAGIISIQVYQRYFDFHSQFLFADSKDLQDITNFHFFYDEELAPVQQSSVKSSTKPIQMPSAGKILSPEDDEE